MLCDQSTRKSFKPSYTERDCTVALSPKKLSLIIPPNPITPIETISIARFWWLGIPGIQLSTDDMGLRHSLPGEVSPERSQTIAKLGEFTGGPVTLLTETAKSWNTGREQSELQRSVANYLEKETRAVQRFESKHS